jgi:hypothetical protein
VRSGKSFLKTTCLPPVQAADFGAPMQRSWLAGMLVEGQMSSGMAGKVLGSGVSNPLKTGPGGSGGLKNSQNWTNQCNSTSEITVQNVGNPVF